MEGTTTCQIHKSSYYGRDLELKAWGPDEKIIVGKYCAISEGVMIANGGDHRTNVASTFPLDLYLPDVPEYIIAQKRNYLGTDTTVIENDVWIGFGASITGGVTVHSGAVIATKAVVFTDVPPYAIVGGNPANIIRYRFSKSIVERMLKIAWWDWPTAEIRKNVDWFYKPIAEFVERFDSQEEDSSHGRVDGSHPTGSTNLAAHRAGNAAGQLRSNRQLSGDGVTDGSGVEI